MRKFRITKCLGLNGKMFVGGDEEAYLRLLGKGGIDAENAVGLLVERGACEYLDAPAEVVEDTDTVSTRPPAHEGDSSLSDLMRHKKDELEAMLPEGVTIKGSGTDGSILKEDLARAILKMA